MHVKLSQNGSQESSGKKDDQQAEWTSSPESRYNYQYEAEGYIDEVKITNPEKIAKWLETIWTHKVIKMIHNIYRIK